MDRRIYKFPIPIHDRAIITIPQDHAILRIGTQGDPEQLSMWAIVNRDSPAVRKEFRVYGTGHEVRNEDTQHNFLATVIAGPMVWHVFEGLALSYETAKRGS